jgi:hypothetical protein
VTSCFREFIHLSFTRQMSIKTSNYSLFGWHPAWL